MNPIPHKIRKRIFSAMQDPEPGSGRLFPKALFWISQIYGGAVKARRSFYRKGILKSKRLPCPVISVGNLTTGGTGKTPMVDYLANLLKGMGYRVAILSRGYGGRAQKHGGVVSDGYSIFMSPKDAGDEPFMLAEQLEGVPILVGSNRFGSGSLAVKRFQAEVLLLDDGFQHLSIERDLNLMLLDCRNPLGNGHLLPRGFLREPISALSMADGFVLTRCDFKSASDGKPPWFLRQAASGERPIFYATHSPLAYSVTVENPKARDLGRVERKQGVAFSGIAQNADFQRSLKALGCDIANFFGFPDHHPYTREELEKIWYTAFRENACFVATTEKDYVRIRGRIPAGIPLVVVGIRLRLLADQTGFSDWVHRRVEIAMAGL